MWTFRSARDDCRKATQRWPWLALLTATSLSVISHSEGSCTQRLFCFIASCVPTQTRRAVAQSNICPLRRAPHARAASSSPSLTTRRCSAAVQMEALTDDRVKSLFAWVSRSIAGDDRYQDIGLALLTVFGSESSPERTSSDRLEPPPALLLREALGLLPPHEDDPCGLPFPLEERLRHSLGPLGAAEYEGQIPVTYPHSLLNSTDYASVDEWTNSLPRTCRQNLRKGQAVLERRDFTLRYKVISPGEPAPHSTLAHFRCVMEHVLRLHGRFNDFVETEDNDNEEGYVSDFFDGVCEAVERYAMSTRGAGTIMEYRDDRDRVSAFCHVVGKGRTLRGQWFYANNHGARSYLWFHCISDLVRWAIEDLRDTVDTVDLGPNGSDGRLVAHADLKRKYGFSLCEQWPTVADYRGPFWSIG